MTDAATTRPPLLADELWESFSRRHLGPDPDEIAEMLEVVGTESLERLIDQTVPESIRQRRPLELPDALDERQALETLREMARANRVERSLIGMGYSDSIMPAVIQRNILENPGWYTAYTPYQAEIAQGRLEALLSFQTMIMDLTGLDIANASMLDESTAAAEAMSLSLDASKSEAKTFLVSEACHPQTIEVVETRAWPLDIEVVVADPRRFSFDSGVFGILLQYPTTDGAIFDYEELTEEAHRQGALVTMAADLLALTLLRPPGELGADIAVGSSQRFGLPMGYGGPHAAFFATRESHRRRIPGRIVGVSKDVNGGPALRLALQTREQHIRREKATSNICTAQVLPAVLAGMYAVYHGAEGLRRIARRIHGLTAVLAEGLDSLGYERLGEPFFDTLRIRLEPDRQRALVESAAERRIDFRRYDDGDLGISLDERSTPREVAELLEVFAPEGEGPFDVEEVVRKTTTSTGLPARLERTSPYLTHAIFNSYRTETEMLRYLHRLQVKDLALDTSMIPLGSCTMKLNATTEMMPVTWEELSRLHPFVPLEQAQGYQTLFRQLEEWLAEVTGFSAISLQPNAGSQGEYSGLLVIRKYHRSRGEGERRICLIPESAHGTNPASAVMAGLKVQVVRCDDKGNIDLDDLREKAAHHRDALAAIMVTYPSTHGVFEPHIREVCDIVHEHGGQVYLDGANLNAQIGLCRPGEYGADVCHLNLHKTFCIPHGGGGPGMGPIGVRPHLEPYLPGHRVVGLGGDETVGAIASAPWGSGSILPISWAYIAMMGGPGLTEASRVAILNANYVARRLEGHYPVLYRGPHGFVAHECILDLRPLKQKAGVEVVDVAKRLMDYGFHAPTISWPVAGTMMVEPTESESKAELDRFCDAMIAIRGEITEIEEGRWPLEKSPLRNAPHTALDALREEWDRPYSREAAAFPASWTRVHKYWPPVSRIDDAYGDRHLVCSCAPLESYVEA